ncbi:DUF5999 family protein [Streptomyces rubiginosohelvolus]|uniref:DUF5999 family protein n=1 Tax=Streptomyces rubiginosohelvolus TaxID=67362 RepID=UPI00363310C8
MGVHRRQCQPPFARHQPIIARPVQGPPAELAAHERRGSDGTAVIIYRPAATRSGEVQRRSLLCNGVLVFEDTGELLPDGRIVAPHRPLALTVGSAA